MKEKWTHKPVTFQSGVTKVGLGNTLMTLYSSRRKKEISESKLIKISVSNLSTMVRHQLCDALRGNNTDENAHTKILNLPWKIALLLVLIGNNHSSNKQIQRRPGTK